MIPRLFNLRGLATIAAVSFALGFGAGGWTVYKFHKAAEVAQLRADLRAMQKERDRLSASAAKAQAERQSLQAKHRKAQTELEKLRRSNATVDAYMSTPVPSQLRDHHKNSNPP